MDWRSRRIRVIAGGGTKHEATTALLVGKAQVRHRNMHYLPERRKVNRRSSYLWLSCKLCSCCLKLAASLCQSCQQNRMFCQFP